MIQRKRVWWKGTYARFRWTVKRFGWHQVSIITPVVWRWSLYCAVYLFPSRHWLLGVAFGQDDDGESYARVGLVFVELRLSANECLSYDDYDELYGDALAQDHT